MEHKQSLTLAETSVKQHSQKFDPLRSANPVLVKLNTEVLPGILDFYLEALKFSALCRSFVVFTYPFSYKIVNKNREALFAENQYCLEYSLETFDKYMRENPVESLFTVTELSPCLTKNFGSIKNNISHLKLRLTEQFENAQKEFMDPEYTEVLDKEYQMWLDGSLNKNSGEKTVVKGGKKKQIGIEDNPNDWYCTKCTYYNIDIPGRTCSMCNKIGRPKQTSSSRRN